jgi:hypothetical protein
MVADYARKRSLASRRIDYYGRDATLRQVADTGTAYAPTRTNTDTTVRVVGLDIAIRDRDGVQTGQVRRKLYISAAGVTPRKRDKIQLGGVWHEIDEVRPLEPGGVVLMWECSLVG